VSNFVLKNKAVRDIWRFKVWYLPLKRLVTLTTVLRYRTACDKSGTFFMHHGVEVIYHLVGEENK